MPFVTLALHVLKQKHVQGHERRTSSETTLNGGLEMTLKSFGGYLKYMQGKDASSCGEMVASE